MSAVVVRGDAAHLPLPDESVDLIVTSPPYFGQRDYQDGGQSLAGQIGGEETPAEYIAALLRCTAEWARVLKPAGSIFVNLGDKFSQRVAVRPSSHQDGLFPGRPELLKDWKRDRAAGLARMPYENVIDGDGNYVREKSLMQLPQRYSIGCTDQLGLILRRDIIWHKTSGMPESAADRCHTTHEYLFHFTKEPRYFSAGDEIREPHQPQSIARTGRRYLAGDSFSVGTPNTLDPSRFCNPVGKMPGSVWDLIWEIPTQPLVVPAHLGVDHFAAFPMELPRRAILGWSPSGICLECGEGRRPVARREMGSDAQGRAGQRHGGDWAKRAHARERKMLDGLSVRTILGYSCACPGASAPTRPAVVLDPFCGTGTSLLVADALGRAGVGVELSADYCRLARWRTRDPAERARALGVPKPPPVPENQGSLFDDLEAS